VTALRRIKGVPKQLVDFGEKLTLKEYYNSFKVFFIGWECRIGVIANCHYLSKFDRFFAPELGSWVRKQRKQDTLVNKRIVHYNHSSLKN
jgi:hypothetical protein